MHAPETDSHEDVDVQERIRRQIASDRIVLYMKGTPEAPECGFSDTACRILKACGARFTAINVLADPEIREGIKVFSNWPTIPQLYVDGEFVGGCDIMMQLYEQGEIQKMVGAAES